MTVAPRRAASGARRLGRVATGAEERDIDAVERLGRRLPDHVLGAIDYDLASGASGAREQAELPERERALEQVLDHRPADDAGGADDRDGEGFRGH